MRSFEIDSMDPHTLNKIIMAMKLVVIHILPKLSYLSISSSASWNGNK